MNRNKSQFSRLLELDRRIRLGEYPNCLTFSVEWEVSQKTVQRDIDFLRDQLGAPLEYDREKKGFRYTDASWFLPAMKLSEGDLLDLLVASRALEQYAGAPISRHIEQIFRKIASLMPETVSLNPELVHTQFSFVGPPARPIDKKIWITIVRGLQGRRTVRMDYRSFEAKETRERLLDPYHIANLHGEWYVFGPTQDTGEVRQFSIARIQRATLTPKGFDVPEGFDPDVLLENTFERFVMAPRAQSIRLRFDAEAVSSVMDRQWHRSQKTVRLPGGGVEIRFKAAGLLEVLRWVLAWGRHVEVLEPAELRKMVCDEVRAMARKTAAKAD